ncbi:hypothetical protein M427DRAFT_76174, partial [Gonapodya prolifera JEL478]
MDMTAQLSTSHMPDERIRKNDSPRPRRRFFRPSLRTADVQEPAPKPSENSRPSFRSLLSTAKNILGKVLRPSSWMSRGHSAAEERLHRHQNPPSHMDLCPSEGHISTSPSPPPTLSDIGSIVTALNTLDASDCASQKLIEDQGWRNSVTTASTTKTHAPMLPPEILDEIFYRVPLPRLYSTARHVCSSWRTRIGSYGQIPCRVNVEIINGIATPCPVHLALMRPGFNLVTSDTHLFAPDGTLLPRTRCNIKIDFVVKEPPWASFKYSTIHSLDTVYVFPRELERKHIPNDDLAAPHYRASDVIIDLENTAVALHQTADPHFPRRPGTMMDCALQACVRLYYKQPAAGETAVWMERDLEEFAFRCLEKQFGYPVTGELEGIGLTKWNNPKMLMDIALFSTTTCDIDEHTRRDFFRASCDITEDLWKSHPIQKYRNMYRR